MANITLSFAAIILLSFRIIITNVFVNNLTNLYIIGSFIFVAATLWLYTLPGKEHDLFFREYFEASKKVRSLLSLLRAIYIGLAVLYFGVGLYWQSLLIALRIFLSFAIGLSMKTKIKEEVDAVLKKEGL
jgi:predicted small integral membrane protein